jgi:hypothetical protein
MAQRKQHKPRPFQPEALTPFALPALRPRMGPGETLWRYTVTVPLEEIQPRKRQRATLEDVINIQLMLVRHFSGFARYPNSPGYGLRDPTKPEQTPEMNIYFRALREELQTALDEGVILVERLETWIP